MPRFIIHTNNIESVAYTEDRKIVITMKKNFIGARLLKKFLLGQSKKDEL